MTGENFGTDMFCICSYAASLVGIAWYEENKQLDERTWPAPMITKLFVEIAEETVSALVRN
jgi:hypothetical protein